MRIRTYYLIIPLCLFVFGIVNIRAQSTVLEIQKWDNSNRKIDLNSLSKITFTNNELVLNYLTNESENIAKSDIQKLFFSQTTGIKSIASDSKVLSVYPNPAIDFITLKNTPDGVFQVSIYSITGSKIKSMTLTSDNPQLNVSNLSKGLYFLKVNNQVSKFTKQ